MRTAVGTALISACTIVAMGGSAITGRADAAAVTDFSLPNRGSNPRAIVSGPDGALWFTEESTPRIGRITTAGKVTEFSLPSDPISIAVGIAAGSDGALWLTQPGPLNRIGRITTRGTISEFPLPAGVFSPLAITAGPEGALWYTANRRIGRITTAGAISDFPVPSGGYPGGIAAGRDGALWFTEGFPVAKVGRITTSGVFTEYALPAAASGPAGIAAGPDGALWFTETTANKIGRITTSGTVTEFPIAAADDVQEGIAAGRDGALWFASEQCVGKGEERLCEGGKIERITTAGAVTAFKIPTRVSIPQGITAGPDGAVWFTEMGSGKIGRIAVPPALRASLKVSPGSRCTSSVARARAGVTGGGKLARVSLSLDGRRLVTTTRRLLRKRISMLSLTPGTHTLKVVAVDKAGSRSVVSRTFRRCTVAPR